MPTREAISRFANASLTLIFVSRPGAQEIGRKVMMLKDLQDRARDLERKLHTIWRLANGSLKDQIPETFPSMTWCPP
jgi:hypothetical protein